MKEKFLPIGTIVLLKDGQKKIMITGYLPVSKNKTVYDYSACLFPEGIISSSQTAVFNHDQIAEIIQEGYSNEETTKFVEALKQYIEKEKISTEKKEEIPQPVEKNETLEMEPNPAPAEIPQEPKIELPSFAQPATPETVPPVEIPKPAAETTPSVVETPVDLSTIQNSMNSPLGVDSIKPFSE